MKVGVYGLWHLGCVTAACLAEAGHDVLALDDDGGVIEKLKDGFAPISEPGLDPLIRKGMELGRLRFEVGGEASLKGIEVLCVTFDTPVDENDKADVDFVLGKIRSVMKRVDAGTLILIFSQLPAGSTLKLQAEAGDAVELAYSPENLRLGKAIEVFSHPDRVVIGVSSASAKEKAAELFKPVTEKIEWMSVPAAEMTKHAINLFLAQSVVFINELALLCEKAGVDVKEVERGLKTDQRIGLKAYVAAGEAFAGGTLARDIEFLIHQAKENGLNPAYFEGIAASNAAHKMWPRTKLTEIFGTLKGRKIGVLGLAYKAGTNTLRRSQALELCRWIEGQGASCMAFDPLIKKLEPGDNAIQLSHSIDHLLRNSEAVLICQAWDGLKDALEISAPMVIIDPAGLLAKSELAPATQYYRVGLSTKVGS